MSGQIDADGVYRIGGVAPDLSHELRREQPMSRPSERKPAPGRVRLVYVSGIRIPWKWKGTCALCPTWVALSWQHDRGDGTGAFPMTVNHVRTEHADLWRECWYCRGQGKVGGPYWMPPPGLIQCRLCHGRGYIETERSKA